MTSIQELMTRGVRTLAPSDSVVRAAQIMDELELGSLPVCQGGELLGMVTDRDIATRAVARSRADAGTTVSDVMSEQVSWCYEDQSVEQVLQQMSDWQIRRVPVLDRNEHLVGIVSLGDLASQLRPEQVGGCLSRISEPAHVHPPWPARRNDLSAAADWALQSGSKPRNRLSASPRGGEAGRLA
ncbi:MAG: CBS domain-containing protein [Betaproteobacteria bacterium]